MREYESLILGAISRRQALEKLYNEKEQLQTKTEKEMENFAKFVFAREKAKAEDKK